METDSLIFFNPNHKSTWSLGVFLKYPSVVLEEPPHLVINRAHMLEAYRPYSRDEYGSSISTRGGLRTTQASQYAEADRGADTRCIEIRRWVKAWFAPYRAPKKYCVKTTFWQEC